MVALQIVVPILLMNAALFNLPAEASETPSSTNTSVVQKQTIAGGAPCGGSADCGNNQGTCPIATGTCLCWQGFTCPDCSRECNGVWPLSCNNDCPEPTAIGGGSCETCSDCFNCDGGTCEGGECVCYSGWTCSQCEFNTESGQAAQCGGWVKPSAAKSGSGLSSASIFGIVLAVSVVLCCGLLCGRGSLADMAQRQEVEEDKARRAQSAEKARALHKMEGRKVTAGQTVDSGVPIPSTVAHTLTGHGPRLMGGNGAGSAIQMTQVVPAGPRDEAHMMMSQVPWVQHGGAHPNPLQPTPYPPAAYPPAAGYSHSSPYTYPHPHPQQYLQPGQQYPSPAYPPQYTHTPQQSQQYTNHLNQTQYPPPYQHHNNNQPW